MSAATPTQRRAALQHHLDRCDPQTARNLRALLDIRQRHLTEFTHV